MAAGDLEQTRVEIRVDFTSGSCKGTAGISGNSPTGSGEQERSEAAPANAFEPFGSRSRGTGGGPPPRWRELGCPYEAAGRAGRQRIGTRTAVCPCRIHRASGQFRAASIVTRSLRALGVDRLPRGPRAATQANPFQLTSREMEVLELLVQGRRTSDIAEALFLSPRTVGHHITAILAKLEVRSRDEAARKAVRLGIVSHPVSGNSSNKGGAG